MGLSLSLSKEGAVYYTKLHCTPACELNAEEMAELKMLDDVWNKRISGNFNPFFQGGESKKADYRMTDIERYQNGEGQTFYDRNIITCSFGPPITVHRDQPWVFSDLWAC